MTALIVLSGLPGAGKSTIAQALSRRTGAIWLRIDSIEQAIRKSGIASGPINDAGYQAAYAVAEDNLRLGRVVIGDCVNPWMLTRNAWREVGLRACAPVIEVEVVCSDRNEHQHRVATRSTDIQGLELPDWAAVTMHDYHPWDRSPLVVDTARQSVAACTKRILSVVQALLPVIPGPLSLNDG